MIVVWIIFIWVVGALLYGVISVLRQARQNALKRRPPEEPEDTSSEESTKVHEDE